MATYYAPSGKFTPHGLLLGLMMGAAVSVPAAFLYDYGIVAIPEAKLRGICCVAFGALIGAAAGVAMVWGKVRNRLVALGVGFTTASFGLYLSWDAWVLHLVHPDRWFFNLIRPAAHPRGLWNAMLSINAIGTWSYGAGAPEHGTILWIVWASEALLVVGIGMLAALAVVQWRPFCERCEQWSNQKLHLYFAPSLPAADFQNRLECQDVAGLEKLAIGNKKQPHYRLDLHTCGNCHSLNTVTLAQSFPKDNRTLINKLMITPDHAAVIRNLSLVHGAGVRPIAVPAVSK